MARIGLVAGEGRLPIVFAGVAKARGDTVIGFGVKGITSDELERHVDRMHWLEWGSFQKGLLLLATERIRKIVMLGKIKKELFFKGNDKLDEKARKTIESLKQDKKDYSILNGIKSVFGKLGMEVLDSTTYMKDLIPAAGTLTKREPSQEEAADIEYGKTVAKTLSGYDIGQTIAVKNKTVIAVEAMEGTDEAITRAGTLVKDGFVVIKVARPDQDMRFDVPLVGLETLRAVISAGGTALALEAGKTLLIDKEEIVKLADEKSVSIVAI